jgi:hypothetical protein
VSPSGDKWPQQRTPGPIVDTEARVHLSHHSERIEDAERNISDFRRSAVAIEARLVKLEVPMGWILRLLGVCTFGILGILGTMVANAIGMHLK